MKAALAAALTVASVYGADPSSGILSRFWLSGQANLITQYHPSFRADYSGPNSFSSAIEVETSRVFTLYSGFRITDSTDVLLDVEATSGANLSHLRGLAGFTNLDLAGAPDSRPYFARLLVHHVFGFGNESVEAGRGPLQLANQLPARRLEIYAGKMSVVDFFDVNAIGGDTHLQFLNWAIDNHATYGYPADTRGYTYGILCEYHEPSWALRVAEALAAKVDSPDHLDANLARSRATNVEIEMRHNLLRRRVGLVRVLGELTHGPFGNYREAIDAYLSGQDSKPDVSAHRRKGNRKYGWGINVEQELNPVLRAYGRAGWSEGRREAVAYTEAEQSYSGGFDLRGARWKRGYDKFGFAAVSSGLSVDHRRYLALGGMGSILGDSGLNYGRENIVEAYYTARIRKWMYAAVDAQRIWRPGYNRDRGPVLVVSFRLHLESALFDSPR